MVFFEFFCMTEYFSRQLQIPVAVFFHCEITALYFQNGAAEAENHPFGRKFADGLYALKITASAGQNGISRPRGQLRFPAAQLFQNFVI